MLKDLTAEQSELADFMSGLSELAHHAGWTEDLEYALWRAVVDGPFLYGRLDLTGQHIEYLQALSRAIGGWIVFDNNAEETFVSLQTWTDLYAERLRTHSAC